MKRPFDFALALIGLIMSAPIWILISIAIWLEDGRPILYFQERVGRGGRIFKAWKFRSMVKGAEAHMGPVAAKENDPRITRVGKVLRDTAMDELPQLINILKGDMSFVGPRADRPWEVEERDGDLLRKAAVSSQPSAISEEKAATSHQLSAISYQQSAISRKQLNTQKELSPENPNFYHLIPNYRLRLLVRPGLTGLAQIYGRYNTPRRQKLRFDLLYIRNISFWLDLKLVFLSLWITLRGKWEVRKKKF